MQLSSLLEALNLSSLYMELSSLSAASKHTSKRLDSGISFSLIYVKVVNVSVL